MAVNRGKGFEEVIKESFLKVPNTSVVRLHDQTMGYLGSSNHCDFIVYHKPFEYHIECKSVHGNTLSIHSNDKSGKGEIYGNITRRQWEGLLEYSNIKGVIAGIICWWIDKDVTKFIPIQVLKYLKNQDYKSIRYDDSMTVGIGSFNEKTQSFQDRYYSTRIIQGKKKRVFFDYDMEQFFNEVKDGY